MIVSWNWLTQYVRLDMPVEVLTERLALTGLNHESTEEVGGDLAIDLEVTSNRPDCLSHIGVAREIGVLFDRAIRVPDPRPRESGHAVEKKTAVAIEAPDLCPRFTARVVSGVKIGESPWWMRKRLETLGVRPISNLVDITNYVMFECGQPMHAYDLDKLAEKRLIVRRARAGERLTAINGKVYDLTSDMLVIADANRPVGLGGVMGGLDTEIGPDTRNVLIEAAQFDAMNIRRTSRALGLSSPSSYRFERPMDPERTEWASRRCAELVLELAGGKLSPGVIDVGTAAPERAPITLRLDQIPRVLGIDIPRAEVDRILVALGLSREGQTETSLSYRAPSWRADLEREIDLIEEAARIHGYEEIPEDRAVPLCRSARGSRERVESAIRDALTGLGCDEACTFSLVAEELIVPLDDNDATAPPIRVGHASRKKENVLRISLVPSLLATRAYNQAHGNADVALFEMANVYLPRAGQVRPDEPARVGIVIGQDFFGIKGTVEALLDRLHVRGELEFHPCDGPLFVPRRAAELLLEGTVLGRIGEIAPEYLAKLAARGQCSAAELELAVLVDRSDLVPRHRHQPDVPAVARDLSLVLRSDIPWAEIAGVVRSTAGPLLEAVEFLDTFEGGDLAPGLHSLHFGLRFRHPERTLTGEEVEQTVNGIVAACTTRFEASLRA